MSSQQEYFVPGFGISRQVMFSHIQFYLGPYASVRPYSYQVRTTDLLCLPLQTLTLTTSPRFFPWTKRQFAHCLQGREGYLVTAPGQPLTKVRSSSLPTQYQEYYSLYLLLRPRP